MSGSKKAEYWSGIIKEWENSSQTQLVFCKAREIRPGLTKNSF